MALCGLTPEQLTELQTSGFVGVQLICGIGELSPEDYDLLLALDEQIEKKTVDKSDFSAFESRPVAREWDGGEGVVGDAIESGHLQCVFDGIRDGGED